MDPEAGSTRWMLSPNGWRGFWNPTVIDGVLSAGDHDRGVRAVDATGGRRIWLCEESSRGSQTFLKAGKTLYGAGDSLVGGVAAIDAATGKVRWTWTWTWTWTDDGSLSPAADCW